MTGDIVNKEQMCYGHLTDFEMADKVRMLMRTDLGHEGVVTGARDRIMYLSQQLELAQRELAELKMELPTTKFPKGSVVLHHKTDGYYVILECPDLCRIEKDNLRAYMYRAVARDGTPQGNVYVRPQAEMEDGRFVLVSHKLNQGE